MAEYPDLQDLTGELERIEERYRTHSTGGLREYRRALAGNQAAQYIGPRQAAFCAERIAIIDRILEERGADGA